MSTSSTMLSVLERLALIDLSTESMETVLRRVCELAQEVVPAVEEVSVSLLVGGSATTAAFTGPLAIELDERQYDLGEGPCLSAAEGGEVQRIDDVSTETRWPDYLRHARRTELGSSLSTPVPLHGHVSAALNFYSRSVGAFAQSPEAASQFAAYAGVVIANLYVLESSRNLAEQLQTAMQSRAVIEQAKGILMGGRSCTAAEAFDILVELSQTTNTKLRVVAQALVDAAAAAAGGRSG